MSGAQSNDTEQYNVDAAGLKISYASSHLCQPAWYVDIVMLGSELNEENKKEEKG